MITNFALSLSLEGIELFHRVPRGWRSVGRVDLASKTLDDDLSALRKKALVIEPDGLRSKVVILQLAHTSALRSSRVNCSCWRAQTAAARRA